jgi:predicted ATPase
MVFEDVHWSDPTARESLDLLIDRIPTLRVLLIITFRSEFMPPWIGRPHVTMLTLNRLPVRQRAEMILHVTGGKVLPKEVADQIGTEARHLLAPVYGWFTEGFDTPVLQEAKALLDELA